jgi:hypothetical protein
VILFGTELDTPTSSHISCAHLSSLFFTLPLQT